MNSQIARLRLAALVAIACASPTVLAADLAQYRLFTLTWSAPPENVDGSPLTDLQGYYVYVGDSPERMAPWYFCSALNPRILLRVPVSVVRYYAVAAVNVDGVESERTGPVSAPLW